MLNTSTAISILQLPTLAALKKTSSISVGTPAPPTPPEVADQFAELFQLEFVFDTQYLGAAEA